MEANVKPGTRCRCDSMWCADGCWKRARLSGEEAHTCDIEATRMVKIPWPQDRPRRIPMCEPCATYHEARQVAK